MIGQTILHYRILEKLGEGGMGVVYKAHDTKLDRPLALKFLPQRLTSGEAEQARFLQEAKAASALNHPNVCTIYAIEEYDGQLFIAMEYVEGQTLAEKKGAIGFKQAIDIGIQVADGLAAAHDKGIIHRDIKPENIMVRRDGIAQIMDFGLAKLRSASSKISRLTKEGSTVGTAGYMSPEQVQGQDVDHRSDIFSFGVLLYELLTGQLPFKGVHETALAYEIVNVDAPPMSSIKQEIDPSLDAIVLECLEKDADERAQSIKQIAVDLKRYKRESGRQRASRVTAARPALQARGVQLQSSSAPEQATPVEIPPQKGKRMHLPWGIAGLFFVCLTVLTVIHFREDAPEVQSINASILPPQGYRYFNENDGGHIALSPDGGMLAFVATDSTGKSGLWVRPLNTSSARQLPETDGATYPFWSPDNKFIGFFASSKMEKISVSGGPPVTICDAPNGRGGTWNNEGVILFSPRFDLVGIYRVSAAGGEAIPLTHIDSSRNETNHRWPHFLPDGKHFIYTTQARIRSAEYYGAMYVSSLDSSVDKLLVKVSSNMAYSGGYLLYARQGSVVAQPFDLGKYEFSADAVPIAEKVEYSSDKSRGIFTISRNGVLIYQAGSSISRTLSWYDRSGKKLENVGDRPVSEWGRLSPDGTRIVLDSFDPEAKTSDIWLYDLVRQISTRFTFERSDDDYPVWSPDGKRVVFGSDREGNLDLFVKSSNGTESEQLLLKSIAPKYPDDWSPDGRYIIYQTFVSKTYWDLWILPLEGDPKPFPFLQSEFEEQAARFSPDGRWVAYQSNESGKEEIYVRPFPTGSGMWQVSSGGGFAPLWSHNGRELFYTSAGGAAMAVEVNGAGATFTVGSVNRILDIPRATGSFVYDVTADGKKLLVGAFPGVQTSAPLTLLTNWDRELKKK